jgi:GTPase
MGLFNRLFKIRKERFIYLIQDMYALKDGGCVLFGQVLHGKIRAGSMLEYCDQDKNRIFSCILQKINQNHQVVDEASKGGAYTAHYGFYIQDHAMDEYEQDNYLILR